MIRHVPFAEIDRQAWDQCICNAHNGLIYAYSWFLDLASDNWDAMVEDDYSAVMPLPWRKKYGIKYVFPPFFIQQLGVFSIRKADDEQIIKFLQAIPAQFGLVELMLNSDKPFVLEGLDFTKQINHILNLATSYENIRSSYSDNLIRNLRKAEKAELKIDLNITPEQLIKIFRDNKGQEISKLSTADYDKLLKIISFALTLGKAEIFGISDISGKPYAGCCMIRSHKRWIFFFSGATPLARENAAIPFLIDNFIRDNAGKDLVFDFEGSNNPNLSRFYKSFGAVEANYHLVISNRLPVITKTAHNLIRRIKKD